MGKQVIADPSYLDQLRAYVTAAESEDPALARKGARFAMSLSRRQTKNIEEILARPKSRRYRDYIVPALQTAQEGEL